MRRVDDNNKKIQVVISNETYKKLLKCSLKDALENETSSSISRYVRVLIEEHLSEN